MMWNQFKWNFVSLSILIASTNQIHTHSHNIRVGFQNLHPDGVARVIRITKYEIYKTNEIHKTKISINSICQRRQSINVVWIDQHQHCYVPKKKTEHKFRICHKPSTSNTDRQPLDGSEVKERGTIPNLMIKTK